MSDQVKLLKQARSMRNVARQSRSAAQQLLTADYRQFVLRYADIVELHADVLERLALENIKTANLQEGESLRDAEREPRVSSSHLVRRLVADQPTVSRGFGAPAWHRSSVPQAPSSRRD
jgi:hypothetical protein